MCGIFGLIAKEDSYDKAILIRTLEEAAKLSQVRGKDSSGIAVRNIRLRVNCSLIVRFVR
ncbi:MAG TPA: hypothetical protein PK073_10255 [Ignavibacteriaceae bacterium]|jgi:glucosamine 6-phosphate synthetase-like amidotransferase/phosphosugar isomerase protein|nr:MAG: hypothetical protein B6D44_02140 [Ignavibacteriales bacterium UTCHB2]HQF43281.1 hypothetical protein [Ignavibacteriaceae bacterium]